MVKFGTLSVVTSIISSLLSAILLLAPQLIFILFEVEGNASAYFLSRRAAMLFLGFAAIAYAARDAEHSVARQSIAFGFGSAMLGLALLGTFELLRGFAGLGILLAVGVELLLATAYFSIWGSGRGKGNAS